jgi:hypothetical protein
MICIKVIMPCEVDSDGTIESRCKYRQKYCIAVQVELTENTEVFYGGKGENTLYKLDTCSSTF